jgi:methylmalonyl-CoA/ethylmalonyl-CoA epimerase
MLPGFGLQFDHFGLATRNVTQSLAFVQGLGYSTGPVVHDPLQGVNLVLCKHTQMPAVEVIFAGAESGPLDAILAQQPQAIYHLCFRAASLQASLVAMKAAGQRVLTVSPPKPAVLFGGLAVSFYMVRGFGLIEIIEDPEMGERST